MNDSRLTGGESTRRSRKRHYILLFMLLGLCFIRYALQINIPQVVLLAVTFAMALTGDADEIMAMCICCIPLHTSIEHTYALLFGMVCFAVKNINQIRLTRNVIPVFLMIMWELLHCFFTSFSVNQFGGHVVGWLLLAVLLCSQKIRFDYALIVRSFVISTIVMSMSLIGKLLFVADFNVAAAFASLRRLGLDSLEAQSSLLVSGGAINQNTLGVLCVFGVTALLQLRRTGRGCTRDIYGMVMLLLFGIMTSSKTFLACLLMMALLLFFSLDNSIRKKIRYMFSAAALAAVAVFIIHLIMPDLLEYYIGRFIDDSDPTTGRIGLMKQYHELILSDMRILFIGIGLQNFIPRVMELGQTPVSPHNGIQELIIAWGIPGLIIFIALIAGMAIQSYKKTGRQGIINYIPLIIILFKVQAGQMLNSSYTMLAFSLAYLSMSDRMKPGRDAGDSTPVIYDKFGVDLHRAVAVIAGKWKPICAVAAACAVLVFGISTFASVPEYESSAMFYVNNRVSVGASADGASADGVKVSNDGIQVSRNLVDSYIVILKSRTFLDKVAEYTGKELTYAQIREMISVAPVNDTEIFRVSVHCPDPHDAEMIANGIAALLSDHISGIIDSTSVRVVDYAVTASEPLPRGRTTRSVLAAVFGGVLMVMLILFRTMINTTIRRREDIEPLADYPMLAEIPDLSGGDV